MHAERTTTPPYPPKHAKQNKVRAGGSLEDRQRCPMSRAHRAANACALPVNLTSTPELGEEG